MNRQILQADGLQKSYNGRMALSGLSFSMGAGRVLGFLGPNGAGKTTAIRILTTILDPSAGRFFIDGIPSDQNQQIRQKIGVLPESLGFPKQMTGIEFLTYFGQHYGLSAKEAEQKGERLLKEVGLKARSKSLIGSYSRGMRQRLGIARTLVNDPVVVFLDEPTLGLDPRGQEELLGLIRRMAGEREAGVILCSHLLKEIEEVCDDVIILKEGQMVAGGTVQAVLGQAERNVVRVHVPMPEVAKAQALLQPLPFVRQVIPNSRQADWLEVALMDAGENQNGSWHGKILDVLLNAGISILTFNAEGGNLQDVFLQLTEDA